MVVIDDNTIAFQDGTSRVYINHTAGAVRKLSQGHTALVTIRSARKARAAATSRRSSIH